MTLNEYYQEIKDLVDDGFGHCEVIYSIDDEGNGFNTVFNNPSVGFYEDGEYDCDLETKNAVCLN